MASKPFLAARIPESLNLKLEEYSNTTGENKTQIVINALAAYIGYEQEEKVQESTSDRLSILERKVAELEALIKQPQQISLLDITSITESEKPSKRSAKSEEEETVITSDNKIDNSQDKTVLDNSQMAELSKIKYETVRSKHRSGKPIEVNGSKYIPKKYGRICKWEPA